MQFGIRMQAFCSPWVFTVGEFPGSLGYWRKNVEIPGDKLWCYCTCMYPTPVRIKVRVVVSISLISSCWIINNKRGGWRGGEGVGRKCNSTQIKSGISRNVARKSLRISMGLSFGLWNFQWISHNFPEFPGLKAYFA